MAATEAVENGGGSGDSVVVPPRPKEKLKPLPKPDDSEYEKKFELLNSKINSMNARIAEIKEIMDDFHEKRKTGGSGSVELRNKLNDEKNRFQSLLAKKSEVKQQLDRINKHRDELRNHSKLSKDKTQYLKREEIDDKINKLKHQMEHTSLSLNEEKKILSQLQDLERAKTTLSQYSEQMDKIANSNELREKVVEQLRTFDQELQNCKDQQKELNDAISALRERESANMPNVPELMAERKECYEIIKEAKAAKSKLYHQRKEAMDEYYTRQREIRQQQQLDRQARAVQRKKEYEERERERRAREEAEKGEPFEEEITLCDQMISYLGKLLPKGLEAAAEQPEASSASNGFGPDSGLKPLKKKGDDALESMFTGLSSGKGKGSKKAKAKASGRKEDAGPQRIQHSIDTIAAFSKLKVELPLTTGSIQHAVESLKAAKEGFQKRRVAEKERRAAAQEASAQGGEDGEAAEGLPEDEAAAGTAGDAPAGAVEVSLLVAEDGETVSVSVKVGEEAEADCPET
uniref:Uncharacterized protein n=2 Tax=Tetraselmis sp. GSL018 TaxID=582737 RepID=A0A061R6X1_9CHLO|eukprot:CAMPEP_0177601168 /NCGR_PEP_ID=MMETSP0419_2-20121207/14085_1 /TAXON_ID=582737 /ORGANISM="Tetraselmis sp., Strain GSL018" /LENGTH=517 /DNA_ID=CAMNT_0019094355 /DNA_START=109 /DNA_END=1662 /DNA_ORIENTATION=+